MVKRLMCLLTVIGLCSFTIADPFQALLKKLEEFTKRYPTEKVYLHFDKPYYATGDNIWFKAYVADARTAEPTSESNILYVELITELDSVCSQLRLPMQNGVSWGDFKLADTLVEGNYRVRAYTQLMRNAGPDFFFDKTIKIGSKWTNRASTKTTFSTQRKQGVDQITSSIVFSDSIGKIIINRPVSYIINYGDKISRGKIRTDSMGKANILLPADLKTGSILATIDLGKGKTSTKTIPIISQSDKVDVQFLPEGGTLVQGITSRIAIKAIDANGKGIDVNGTIVDDKGEEVCTFQTTHLGMGSFYFSPMPGRIYTAKLKHRNGTDQSVSLPKAVSSGYLLTVNQLDTSNINVKVTLSSDLLNEGDLNLIAHRNGMVYLSAKVSTAKQVAKITMPNGKFPSGIVQLTLLSPQNVPVAERLVFINNASDKVDVKLTQLKSSYTSREKVELELTSNTQGNFSIAIINADLVLSDEENESNILTSMLLTSELKGYVEKPNYYFINTDAIKREHLDNLLLTQGWRKLDWKSVNNSQLSQRDAFGTVYSFPAEKSIRISGTITKDKKPLANSKISLMTNTDGLFMIDTLSDKNGRFVFEGLEFADSAKFIIQARSEVGKKTIDIMLDAIEGQRVNPRSNFGDIEVNVNQSMQGYLKESTVYFEEQNRQGLLSKTILLKEVKIEGVKKNPAKNSSNWLGPGNADQIFDGDDMINSPSLATYLFGKMDGVTVKERKLAPISMRLAGLKVRVDGNEVPSDFTLDDIKPEDVESIEILSSPSKWSVYRSPQVLITTRRGPPKWPIVKYAPGLITYKPKGYYNAREFYSPMYNVNPSDKPDLRTTVFWAPNLATDKAGKVKFEYFNTDKAGNYRVVLEGIDTDGRLARKTYSYKVN